MAKDPVPTTRRQGTGCDRGPCDGPRAATTFARAVRPYRHWSLVVWALAVVAGGCHWHRGNEVVVGEVAALTGDRSPWGEDLHRGIALAVDQQNARGGINGR